jgi:CheY-like chemotaxis protein
MGPSKSGMHLLIIDDEPLVRTLAAESLRSMGFEVDEADDGSRGLALMEQRRPDLVLLDVMMPGMDGCEVCRSLRERPDFSRIPVIMLTGLDDTASVERAYDSGATDFMAKPINPVLLAYRIRYALRASRLTEEIYRHRNILANAQRITHLGSWTWQVAEARFECSVEYCRVIDKPEIGSRYQWRDLLHRLHPDDLARVSEAMDAAQNYGTPYGIEYRLLCLVRTGRGISRQRRPGHPH